MHSTICAGPAASTAQLRCQLDERCGCGLALQLAFKVFCSVGVEALGPTTLDQALDAWRVGSWAEGPSAARRMAPKLAYSAAPGRLMHSRSSSSPSCAALRGIPGGRPRRVMNSSTRRGLACEGLADEAQCASAGVKGMSFGAVPLRHAARGWRPIAVSWQFEVSKLLCQPNCIAATDGEEASLRRAAKKSLPGLEGRLRQAAAISTRVRPRRGSAGWLLRACAGRAVAAARRAARRPIGIFVPTSAGGDASAMARIPEKSITDAIAQASAAATSAAKAAEAAQAAPSPRPAAQAAADSAEQAAVWVGPAQRRRRSRPDGPRAHGRGCRRPSLAR